MATAVRESTRDEKDQNREARSLSELALGAPPAVDAPDEDKADFVVARYAAQDDHYRGLFQLWMKVLLFLIGKHWMKWEEQLSVYVPDDDVPAWRQQPVTNYTYAFFRAAIAKLSKNRAKLEVVPPSGDSEDVEAAKLGEAILEFLHRHLKSPQKFMRALGWFICTGNVFFDVDWDENAGRLIPRTALVEIPNEAHDENDPESTPTVDVDCACDENGEPYRRDAEEGEELALDGGNPYDLEREPDAEPEGEVELSIDDPFSTRFNPDCTDPNDATEWYTARLWPKQLVIDTFDLDEDEDFGLTAGVEDSGAIREEYDDLLSRAAASAPDPFQNTYSGITGTDQAEAIGDRVLVIYAYFKGDPDSETPKGRHWIVAGRKKVWPPENDPDYPDGEAPLPHGFWPPRVPLIDTPIPGQPQGIGLLTQIVNINEQFNHLDGKIAEHHVTMAMGGVWFVAPEDRGIVITSEPGQVKVSKAMGARGKAGAPFQADIKPLSEPVYREREVLQQKMQFVASLSDLDLSQRPEGVTAGRAFLVIQEASDAAIMPSLLAFEQAIEEIGRRELVIVQEHYSEDRTIRIKGENGAWEFRSFKGADLRDGLDVRVQVGSSFPWSKSAQWDTKLSVLQALPQLVLKPDGSIDREELAKYLDAGASGLSTFESDQDPDMVEFQREIAMFEAYNPMQGKNELPQLGVWMNIPIKQRLAYDFMKRNYQRVSRWQPEAKLAFGEWLRQLAAGTQAIVDQMMPQAQPGDAGAGEQAPPAGGAPGGEASPGAAPGGAPGGAPQPPAPGGGPPLQLVPPGGEIGRQNTPIANRGQSKMQLTKGDRASAGQ